MLLGPSRPRGVKQAARQEHPLRHITGLHAPGLVGEFVPAFVFGERAAGPDRFARLVGAAVLKMDFGRDGRGSPGPGQDPAASSPAPRRHGWWSRSGGWWADGGAVGDGVPHPPANQQDRLQPRDQRDPRPPSRRRPRRPPPAPRSPQQRRHPANHRNQPQHPKDPPPPSRHLPRRPPPAPRSPQQR
jgi:hypothetical protein